MSADVNDLAVSAPSRAERTEQKIVAAARDLFVERGYQGTTLSDVAAAAGVSDRTIYVRFASKAELMKRVVDVAVVGDTAHVPLADRDWVAVLMNAPTLEERLTAESTGVADLMHRVAPVQAVAMQAEGEEPLLAAAAQAARIDTMKQGGAFWRKLYADGLLHPEVDLDWVIPTVALLANSETYIHMTRTLGWTMEDYRSWRYRTWLHFATTPSAVGRSAQS
ncbi:TetR/AcrR family transcriptional regulator [Nocardioides humilatus]|uniref:TetR/AcrR family transcriptional regulator n=1 Tax=Nocardioides humilatus TaxID=2607660 RepID=UPI00165F09F4|nr:TetR/AcrR family transcriptional regulator [Nocardioides humilatus]